MFDINVCIQAIFEIQKKVLLFIQLSTVFFPKRSLLFKKNYFSLQQNDGKNVRFLMPKNKRDVNYLNLSSIIHPDFMNPKTDYF